MYVLAVKYETEKGRINRGGWLSSVWWKDLCDILEGEDDNDNCW